MASIVQICNQALIKLGARTINALTDANESARLCSAKYEWVRDNVLRDHPWNCATERAQLAALSTSPLFEWDYQYQQPSDCLRILDLFDSGGDRIQEYVVEGRKILCDFAGPVYLVYIKRVTDPTVFDPMLAEAIAARLAVELCESFQQSASQYQLLLEVYERILKDAKSKDSQEGVDTVERDSNWIRERF